MQKKKGKIVTIASTKGGTGKTIVSLNLAGVYSLMGYKVLLIDFDLFGGGIATFLNSDNDRTIFNFVEDYSNNRYESIENYIYKYNDLISIIAAPKDPRSANKIESKYVDIILSNVVYNYDVILIDTSHLLNEITIVSLDISDSILYVLTNDSLDLKNSRSFMSIIKDVGFDNITTLLNSSFYSKNYFSMYDIKNIIKHNIDFTLTKSFFIKNIDKYIMEGNIPILNEGIFSKKDMKLFEKIGTTLIEDKEVKKWKSHYQKLLK